MYQAFKDADQELYELTLRTEHHYLQVEMEILSLRDIWPCLPLVLQEHQERVLRLLETKLYQATVLLSGVIKDSEGEGALRRILQRTGVVNRRKFAWSVKKCMENAIRDLEDWHRIFDPSWFLILRVPNLELDQRLCADTQGRAESVTALRQLRREIGDKSISKPPSSRFRPPSDLTGARAPIPFSSAQLSHERNSRKQVLIDVIVSNPWMDPDTTTEDTLYLAKILAGMIPFRFGLLACGGVVLLSRPTLDSKTASRETPFLELLFDIPPHLEDPRSLRSLLLQYRNQTHSLSERLQLAKQLAKSVVFLHTFQLVHKNIRPETVIVFQDGKSTLGVPFLVGFERFRSVDGLTYHVGDSAWEKNLYRHPTRQGSRPEEYYMMQHDIYSLGVLLLEIGLWTPFVQPTGNVPTFIPGPELNIAEPLATRDARKKAFEIKRTLVHMATDLLPSRMGSLYAHIVQNCLKSLDADTLVFAKSGGESSDDEDGIFVGVCYIENVIQALDKICL
jgi:hypothetical protein